MSSFAETLQKERRERLQRFAIAAANPKMKSKSGVREIPNTPFGVPKIAPTPTVDRVEALASRIREQMAQRVLEEGYSSPSVPVVPATFRIDRIQTAVAEYYDTTRAEILSHRRHGPVILPRQIAMYLSKILTPRSLPEIGRMFGRDHTTVLHAVRKVEWLIETEPVVAADIEILKTSLNKRKV